MSKVCAKALLFFLLLTQSCSGRVESPVDSSSWQVHCFGRVLMSLPVDSVLGGNYQIQGGRVEKRVLPDGVDFKEMVERRLSELESEPHEDGGSMSLGAVWHDAHAAVIHKWAAPYSQALKEMEVYRHFPGENIYYSWVSGYSDEYDAYAAESSEKFVREVSRYSDARLLSGPGYCAGGVFVPGNEIRSETSQVGMRFHTHRGVNANLFVSTRSDVEEPGLLSRIAAEAGSLFAPGVSRLRSGSRTINGIKGQEFLLSVTENGHKTYVFKWESPGKPNSISEPMISIELETWSDGSDGEGPPPRPFATDTEALEFWDALTETIRMRPGSA